MSFPAFDSSVSEPRGKNSKKAVVTCVRGLITTQSEQDWLSLLLLLFSLQGIPEGKGTLGIKKWKVIEKVSEIGQMGSVPALQCSDFP